MEDKQEKSTKPRRKINKNFVTHLFFCWQIPIFIKGWKKELTDEDLCAPFKEHESERLGNKLEKLWLDAEKYSKTPSLLKVLIKLFGFEFVLKGVMVFPAEIATFLLVPFFLTRLLEYYKPGQTEVQEVEAYVSATVIILMCLLRAIVRNWIFMEMTTLGMKIRTACSSVVYRRILNLRKSTLQNFTIGNMVNLLSNDVGRFDKALTCAHYIWIGPIEVILGVWYMECKLGHTAIVGFVLLILSLLLQMFLYKKVSLKRSQVAVKTDNRIRLTSDVISGIRTIKMHTWEERFSKLIQDSRKSELKEIKLANYFRLTITTFSFYVIFLSLFTNILSLALTDSPITAQYVYSIRSIYQSLMISVTIFFPSALLNLAEAKISVKRIEQFLMQDFQGAETVKVDYCHHNDFAISMRNVSTRWENSSRTDTLREVRFTVFPGESVGVIGAVGSGKSTLLQVILKELTIDEGSIDVEGTISYAPQDSWIFSASIRQNILFGQPMQPEKYNTVVKVCALEHDLDNFAHGDQTLVGERGVMLSGGQKARVNLARAIYKDADIYLLDDPLSAVDPHVARHIFDQCILGYLRGKCVVLVTHQVHFLRDMKRVYVLEMGKIVDCRNELAKNKPDALQVTEQLILKDHCPQSKVKEHRTSGINSRKVYLSYCHYAGHWSLTVLTVIVTALYQVFVQISEYIVSCWVNLEEDSIDATTRQNLLLLYTVFVVLSVLFIHLSMVAFAEFCIRASKNLHKTLLTKTVDATMTFFNDHSSGRILNRFSKDIGLVDEHTPLTLIHAVTALFTLISILVLIAVINYWMIIPAVLLTLVIYFYGVIFQSTNTNIKRTEATTRSFILSHLTATIQGLTTIRVLGAQKMLSQEFDGHLNVHNSAFYLSTAAYAALGFWTDATSVAYTACVVGATFFLKSGTHPGYVGLVITQSICLVGFFEYVVRTWGELESQMNSVERILEYINLPSESDTGKITPSEFWPKEGNIIFDSVSLRYSPTGPSVLKRASFHVQAGEKIGIVGRTGAGKTSLISALFRLFEFEGTIFVDGLDTKTVPLKTLRSKISIIPQDPVLFLGTLRKNLDPFDEFTDGQIWNALDELKMKTTVANLPSAIDSTILEGGSNFSVGQKQLLCLVRTMLRRNKIIVLDESTANVDMETDALIQLTIRSKLKCCTIFTIAHRVSTVIDSDKILVMDDGRIVEFDNPLRLLQNVDSAFYGLVKKANDERIINLVKSSM